MIMPYFVIIPLVTAFLIVIFTRNHKNTTAFLGIFAAAVLLSLAVISFILVSKTNSPILYNIGNWQIPWSIGFVMDYLASFMLIVISMIALVVLIFSFYYMNHYTDLWKYYTLFMLMLAGMNGFVLTCDFFNLFIFMEIALIAAYTLVGFGCEAEELEAAFKYAVIGSLTSLFILLAIGILYALTSTLNMADIGRNITTNNGLISYFVFGLLLAGFGLKAALVPFHAWLPDAHSSAPAPVSAMLSGVLIKTLGVYALIRVFFHVFPISTAILNVFLILGAITILVGVLVARLQFDFKRLLAYSSISQIGYIILGLGLGTPLGILGAIFHLFNHGLMKSLLFLNAGSIEYSLGTRDLREIAGANKQLKPTVVTSMIASLSISGIPPFNGFFSKLIIIIAAIQAKQPVYALVAALGSVLTLALFLKVQKYVIHSGSNETSPNFKKIPFSLNFSMILLALLCLLSVALIIPGIKEFTLDKVVATIQNRQAYLNIIPGGRP
jgi:multicomponent Na+:H+ antiporter subunit D